VNKPVIIKNKVPQQGLGGCEHVQTYASEVEGFEFKDSKREHVGHLRVCVKIKLAYSYGGIQHGDMAHEWHFRLEQAKAARSNVKLQQG
jgi:hypothetical protein